MLPFRKILFPVDYSEPCQAVVPYVKDMLRHFSAGLTLVHAYGPAAVFADHAISLTDPSLPEKVQINQDRRLCEFAQELFPGEHVELIAELGEAGSVIDKVAHREGADLIMLATRGHGPLRRFLLGSVTAKVLHDLSAVVWTGIGSALTGHTPNIPYTSVVCALDQSAEAEGVLRAAAAFACSYRATLSILHVVETPPPSPEVDLGPIKKELIEAAHFNLRELKGKLDVEAPHTVLDTNVAEGVRQEVLRRQADLVITGRGHSQATFSRMWSHLYPIVREAPCPVLSI
jgi:nucleotide-binding universal stress UspA family protein